MDITYVNGSHDCNDTDELSITIGWLENNGEFGELTLLLSSKDDITIDTESMGKDHFLKVMEFLYHKAIVK